MSHIAQIWHTRNFVPSRPGSKSFLPETESSLDW
jgi:hypothetical protein